MHMLMLPVALLATMLPQAAPPSAPEPPPADVVITVQIEPFQHAIIMFVVQPGYHPQTTWA